MYLVKFCSSVRSTASFRWERDMSAASIDSLTASYVRALIPKHPRTRTRPHSLASLGLVHIRNVIEQPRPISAAEPLTFHVSIAQPYEHPRGSAFDVTADARDESGEIVWHSVSTYLHVHVHKADSGIRRLALTPLPPTWHLPPDLGRRYASISGDRNPIHLYPWTAKLFGFPRQIAHGMWTMARCTAALDLADPAAAMCASVDFRAPVRLPSESPSPRHPPPPTRPPPTSSCKPRPPAAHTSRAD
jgi:hypothetical protein